MSISVFKLFAELSTKLFFLLYTIYNVDFSKRFDILKQNYIL